VIAKGGVSVGVEGNLVRRAQVLGKELKKVELEVGFHWEIDMK
jgi:hypothetical protein